MYGEIDSIRILADAGGSVNLGPISTHTPLWIALKYNQAAAAKLLREYGA